MAWRRSGLVKSSTCLSYLRQATLRKQLNEFAAPRFETFSGPFVLVLGCYSRVCWERCKAHMEKPQETCLDLLYAYSLQAATALCSGDDKDVVEQLLEDDRIDKTAELTVLAKIYSRLAFNRAGACAQVSDTAPKPEVNYQA